MGFDLTSETGAEFRLGGVGWTFYLNLAERYGWSPAGTLPPDSSRPEEWPGNYDSNEGQRVTGADAAALATALQAALADPNRLVVEASLARELSESLSAALGGAAPVDPPDGTEVLESLREFCHQGSFMIE